MSRKRIILLFSALVSIFFLYIAFRNQEWAKIIAALQEVNFLWLVFASMFVLADYVFRAWRWGVILKPAAGRQLPMNILFPVLLLGFAANNVFPARAGEVWRVWGLAHRTHVPKTIALSTLIVERVFDVFTLLFLLAVASLVYPLSGEAKGISYIVTGLFACVFIGLMLFLFFEQWTLKIATHLMSPIPPSLRERLLDIMGNFVQGLHALKEPQALASIIGSSLLAWGSQALSFSLILLAFGLLLPPVQLFGVSMLMLAMINLFIMIPAGPGSVGTFELAGQQALMITAITSSEHALAIVLVIHALQWLLVTGMGLIIALQAGINFKRFSQVPELTEG